MENVKEMLKRETKKSLKSAQKNPLLEKLKAKCPKLECLITVSPVRHIRDGLVNNQKSKATLVLAAHEISKKFDFVHYFPAYEIFMDDLRDYRFYKADLIHPSKLGIDYIWDYVQSSLFNLSTQTNTKAIKKVIQAINHRPFNPTSDGHRQFIQSTLKKIEQLEKDIPSISWAQEKSFLLAQLQ